MRCLNETGSCVSEAGEGGGEGEWVPTSTTLTVDSRRLTQPLVTDNTDEVLRRQRLKNGHKKVQNMLFLSILLLEQEVLVMEQHFTVDIFYKDPKGFRISVDLFIPLEVRSNRQLHLQCGPEGKKKKKREKLAAVGFEPTPSK